MGGLAGVTGLRLGAWGSGGLVRGRGLQGGCLGGLGGSGGLGLVIIFKGLTLLRTSGDFYARRWTSGGEFL
jgi:hypothetical protein